jgi:ADP-heptose:LPS heptosyltransferase
VIGAPGEWERVQAIAAAGGGDPVATPGLRDALALVAEADFIFTPDTSLVHAASAFGVPVVAMYVRQTAVLWGAYGVPGRAVSSDARRTLDPVGADRVVEAVDALLAELSATEGAVDGGSAAAGRNFSARSRVSTTGPVPPAA